MPTIGNIKKGVELGYKSPNKWMIWIGCLDCGKERWVPLYKGKPANLRCGSCAAKSYPRFRGCKASNWKGGIKINAEGYKQILLQPDDFFYSMSNPKGYIFEHRLVMAKSLGRCLHLWEIVHHKNHIRSDNRIENLQLVSDDRHNQLTRLETRIKYLENKVKLLEWQIREFNKRGSVL